MIRKSSSESRPNRVANRKASPFSKQSLAHAARVMAPTLFALTFASVAHAQGTMDFSGAQTLMGTFKTFAIYAGAVICFGGLIFAGIRMMSVVSRMPSQASSVRCLALAFSDGARAGLVLSPGSRCRRCHAHDQAGRTVTDQSGIEQAESQARA
jgi:hypothetical protein